MNNSTTKNRFEATPETMKKLLEFVRDEARRMLQAACAEVWPETRILRCWFHKSGNVLDKLPKAIQAKTKGMFHLIFSN